MDRRKFGFSFLAALVTGTALLTGSEEASAQYREMRGQGGGGGANMGSAMSRRLAMRGRRSAARRRRRRRGRGRN